MKTTPEPDICIQGGVTGKYFEDCQEAAPFTPGIRRGVADYALDPASARRLWQVSAELTGADA